MKQKNPLLVLILVFMFSCGSSETKPVQPKAIDTLAYEEAVAVKPDSLSLIDSILSAIQNQPVFIDDTAALALKAKLVADTASVKISDSVKKEIKKAIDYMNRKQNR